MSIPDYIVDKIKSGKFKTIEITQHFMESDVDELVTLLNQHSSVTHLTLYRLNLSNACTPKLAQLKFVQELDLAANNLNDAGILPLLSKSNFTHLDLSRNNLHQGAAEIIMQHSQQVWINISENPGIDDKLIALVNDFLKKNKARHLENMLMGKKSPEQITAPAAVLGKNGKSPHRP